MTTSREVPEELLATDYPPEPWDLRGHGYVSLWLVPARVLPELPAGLAPISLLGKAVVATAFVDYLPGGLLPYHELLVSVLVRANLRPGICITDIWVDSASSLAGGRQLWGIPKELAEFDLVHTPAPRASARVADTVLAEATIRPARAGLRLPFPIRGSTMQTLRGALARTPLRATGRVHPAGVTWRFDGRLAWLRPYRPLITVAATDFGLRFGPRKH